MIAPLNQMADIWWQWMGSMFWQVGLLILLITLIDMSIRRWAWPQVRYLLWGLVFLKLVIPPTWQMPTSIIAWTQPLFQKHVSIQVGIDDIVSGTTLSAPESAFHPEEPASGAAHSEYPTWRAGLLLAWLGGMAAFAAALTRRLSRLRKWQRREKDLHAPDPEIPHWFHELLAGTARRLKLRRTPAVLFAEDAVSPAVFGIIRPTILLPEGYLGGLSREEAEHVLIHELCHLKRGDLLVHWLCLLIQIVYWFNPLLIWARRRMRHVCEICCDLSVAEILREKTRHYRKTLLKIARELFCETMEPSLGLLGLFEEPFRIIPRLRWLERETWGHRKRKIAATLVTSLVMMVCVMPMSGVSSSASTGEYTLEPVSVTPEADGPLSDEAKAALGEAEHRLATDPDDFAAAREPLMAYFNTHPHDTIPKTLYMMLGQLWYVDQKNEEHLDTANLVYETAYEIYPDEKSFLLNYAMTTYELEQYKDAATLFEDYYFLDETHDINFLENAAGLYMMSGNEEEAAALFENLYDLDESHDVKYLKNAIACYRAAGDDEEAERLMERLPASEEGVHTGRVPLPEDAEAALMEARRRIEADPADYAAAREPLIDFMETHSGSSVPKQLYMMLGQFWQGDQDREGALEAAGSIYETAYEIYPDETVFLLNQATIIHALGKYGDAAALFESYYLLDESHDVQILENAAALYEMAGNESDAKRIRSQLANISQVSEPPDGAPILLKDTDTPPQVLEAFPPRYPDDAKKSGIEGRVLLRFVVDTDGYAKEPEIVEATPADIFDDAAREAIAFYKFQPAVKDGIPVACIVQLPMTFSID